MGVPPVRPGVAAAERGVPGLDPACRIYSPDARIPVPRYRMSVLTELEGASRGLDT